MPQHLQRYENEELFRRFVSGDERAFEDIYYGHVTSLLHTAAQKLGSKERAKEAVQDIFLKLFLARNELKHFDNIGGYLATALKRKIINLIRDDLIHQRHLETYSKELWSQEGSPSDYVEHKELDEKIQVVLSGLAPQCRRAFVLSRYEHLSYLEIAERMGISVKTVEMHISRALRVLKQELQGYDLVLLVLLSALACGET